MKPTLHLVASAAALFLLAPSTAQELRSVDAFAEALTPGTPVDGVGGGAGWDGPWIGTSQRGFLLAYYPLDTDARDLSLIGAAGTVNGGAFVVDQPGLAWSTGSYELNVAGAGEHIGLDNRLFDFSNAMLGTVSAWIKTSSAGVGTIVAASDSTRPSSELRLIVEGGRLRYDVRGDLNSFDLLDSTTRVDDGQWHHVAVVVEGSGLAILYVDGVEEVRRHQGWFRYVENLDTMSIGRNVDSGGPQWHFAGQIDDVALWGSALSAAEIAALAAGTTRPSGIVGVPTLQGPRVLNGSPSTPAYGSRGLPAFGGSLGGNEGLRAGRRFLPQIDLRQDRSYYLSCLIRREDFGATLEGDVQLADAGAVRGSFGWDATGHWRCGINATVAGSAVMQDRTDYFCVLRLDAVSSGDDSAFLKVYGPSDTIDASDAGFTANGGWTVVGGTAASGARNFTLWVTPSAPGCGILIDEIRIGDSWDAVTRVSYGSNCGGATIGGPSRPVLGGQYAITLQQVAPNTPLALNVGVSRQAGNVGPLPFDLTPFGGTGCFVLASDEFPLPFASNGSGGANVVVPIPNDPVLLTTPLFAQWVAADFVPGANPLQVRLSDALEIVFQE